MEMTWKSFFFPPPSSSFHSSIDRAVQGCSGIFRTCRSLFPQENKEASLCSGSTLGAELCVVHRRFSGNLQLPPLSWRQAEKERDRGRSLTPEDDPVGQPRPTSLPIVTLPRIDITKADPDR